MSMTGSRRRLGRILDMSRIAWGALTLEVFSIVLAILLGFAVNEWRKDREEAAQADRVLHSIQGELLGNLQQVRERSPYYRMLSFRLDSLVSLDSQAGNFWNLPGWRGLNPPSLRTAAYQAALATGSLQGLAFEQVDACARAYELQEDLEWAIRTALAAAIDGRMQGTEEWLRLFQLMYELTSGTEQVLKQSVAVLEL